MEVGCQFYLGKASGDWLSTLLRTKFYSSCGNHPHQSKNEINVFCIDCGLSCCRHCISSSAHWLHRRLQICKYVYQNVIRFQDAHKHLDCSKIQTYKINGEKAVHLNPRPQSKDFKPSKSRPGTCCEACGRYIQDQPNRFCSIACKVLVVPSEDQSRDESVPPLLTEMDGLSLKSICSSEESLKGRESSFSTSDETLGFGRCASRRRKRKGVPRRAPLW